MTHTDIQYTALKLCDIFFWCRFIKAHGQDKTSIFTDFDMQYCFTYISIKYIQGIRSLGRLVSFYNDGDLGTLLYTVYFYSCNETETYNTQKLTDILHIYSPGTSVGTLVQCSVIWCNSSAIDFAFTKIIMFSFGSYCQEGINLTVHLLLRLQ